LCYAETREEAALADPEHVVRSRRAFLTSQEIPTAASAIVFYLN
jgi:hypothetical protein